MNTAEETAIRVDCGDWRLVREIGRGAYGVVYVAENDKGERAAVAEVLAEMNSPKIIR